MYRYRKKATMKIRRNTASGFIRLDHFVFSYLKQSIVIKLLVHLKCPSDQLKRNGGNVNFSAAIHHIEICGKDFHIHYIISIQYIFHLVNWSRSHSTKDHSLCPCLACIS